MCAEVALESGDFETRGCYFVFRLNLLMRVAQAVFETRPPIVYWMRVNKKRQNRPFLHVEVVKESKTMKIRSICVSIEFKLFSCCQASIY